MANNDLNQLLQKLHDDLDNTKAVDEKGRELLRVLNADIQELLDRSENRESDDNSLLERLQESIDHFEVTHPALTSALSNIMTALNNAGI